MSTTTLPLAQRITQGLVTSKVNAIDAPDGRRIALVLNTTEWRANTELIAEAFNTAHETGLTPRQLADERAELIKALADCAESLSRLPDVDGAYRATCYQQAAKALANAIAPTTP
jgi:hypothetical protein